MSCAYRPRPVRITHFTVCYDLSRWTPWTGKSAGASGNGKRRFLEQTQRCRTQRVIRCHRRSIRPAGSRCGRAPLPSTFPTTCRANWPQWTATLPKTTSGNLVDTAAPRADCTTLNAVSLRTFILLSCHCSRSRVQSFGVDLHGFASPFGEKITFQSSFMLTTVQPLALASSSPLSSRPIWDSRSYAHSRSASVWRT